MVEGLARDERALRPVLRVGRVGLDVVVALPKDGAENHTASRRATDFTSMNVSFPPRIVLTGAESTGKSTLARALAAHLGTVWSPEMARYYLDAKGQLSSTDALPIAYAQRGVELWLESQASAILLCDTDVLSTIIYARELYGFVSDELELLLAERPAKRYLLLDTDIDWHADPTPGQRESAQSRARFHELFQQELEQRHLPFRLISARGNTKERTRRALEAVRSVLNPSL